MWSKCAQMLLGRRYDGRWRSVEVLIASLFQVKQEARLPAKSED